MFQFLKDLLGNVKYYQHCFLQPRCPYCRSTKGKSGGCWRGYLSGARCRFALTQLIPLPLTVSCFSKIQIGFSFLVPAHPGSPGKMAVKRVYVYVCMYVNGYRRHTFCGLCMCVGSWRTGEPAKVAEPIEMQFENARVSPRNHVLD